MKLSSDYDHDDRHWKFARTLPRLPYKPQRRIDWHGIALLALAIVVLFVGVVK